MVQDLPLELEQGGSGLEPQLVDQPPAAFGEHLERLRLATRPVERQHECSAQALLVRMLGREALELGQHLVMSAQLELRLDPLLDRVQPHALEARGLDTGERLVAEVDERLAAKQRQRGAQLIATFAGSFSSRAACTMTSKRSASTLPASTLSR